MRIAVLNGPNLNLLGVREPDVYGSADYASLVRTVSDYASQAGAEVIVAQTNSEGGLVGMIQRCLGRADGIVINPAAYTHTSVAVLDALKAVALPAVEVHLSDVSARETSGRSPYAGRACARPTRGWALRAICAPLTGCWKISPAGDVCRPAVGNRGRGASPSRFERVPGARRHRCRAARPQAARDTTSLRRRKFRSRPAKA